MTGTNPDSHLPPAITFGPILKRQIHGTDLALVRT
jgi:hypothetical protein